MDEQPALEDMEPEDAARFKHVLQVSKSFFGSRFERITCPGGSYRNSYRVHLSDQTFIATSRESMARTRLEAYILYKLAPKSDFVPRFIGFRDDVLFQSDAGTTRLSSALSTASPAEKEALAVKSVEGLFKIHRAARDVALHDQLPHLGSSKEWVERFVNMVRRVEKQGTKIGRGFNRFALHEALASQPVQFVKWDCRSGNAALDDEGNLRWFDFEYAGVRHGAEDFSWLIADETLPVLSEDMLRIIMESFDSSIAENRDSWMNYLCLYTVFHAMERLRLIQYEVKERGWKSKEKILSRDDVGMHPEYAAKICEVAVFFSNMSPLTAALTDAFETLAKKYGAMAIQN